MGRTSARDARKEGSTGTNNGNTAGTTTQHTHAGTQTPRTQGAYPHPAERAEKGERGAQGQQEEEDTTTQHSATAHTAPPRTHTQARGHGTHTHTQLSGPGTGGWKRESA